MSPIRSYPLSDDELAELFPVQAEPRQCATSIKPLGQRSNSRKPPPTFEHERILWAAGADRVVGIDEVGMGAACSAIVVGAVELSPGEDEGRLQGVRDSKQVYSRRKREFLAQLIRIVARRVALAAASATEIDRLGVEGAWRLAVQRVLARMGDYDIALIDGARPSGWVLDERARFLVGGDHLSLSVAAASLVAKVMRDQLLDRLAIRYPGYDWDHNAGYLTENHRAGLQALGPTPHHRRGIRLLRKTRSS